MGFDHFAVIYDQWIGCTAGPSLLIHDYPDQWANAYISFGLGDRDPVRRACGQSFQGFIWREIGRLISLTRGDLKMLSIGREHGIADRSEEHTSELQSLMRTSYAVFCLKK